MLPTPNEREKRIAKLEKQVARYEAKGYADTAAHEELRRLLESPEAVSPRNTKKVKPEDKEDLVDG